MSDIRDWAEGDDQPIRIFLGSEKKTRVRSDAAASMYQKRSGRGREVCATCPGASARGAGSAMEPREPPPTVETGDPRRGGR